MLNRSFRQQGFGLLEAIVALAIFSAVGIVLFSWINRSVTVVAQIDELVDEAKAEELAVAELMQENLFEEKAGTIELPDGWRVSWQARPLSERQQNMTLVGRSSGRHSIQLFRVTAQLSRVNSASNGRNVVTPIPRTFGLTRLMVSE